MIVPSDKVLAGLLMGRTSLDERMSFETQEIFKRLLRAHLNLEQAHEYLRQRITKVCNVEAWDLKELFDVADCQSKGSVSIYDLERLIIEHKKCGSRSLIDDIELIM